MGYQMSRPAATALFAFSALWAVPASSQPFTEPGSDARAVMAAPAIGTDETNPLQHAVGLDLFASTDADHTEVRRAGINLDWRYAAPENYLGVRFEKARFKPLGQKWTGFERAYLRYADKSGGWSWTSQIGTDGHTALGAVSVHDDARFRKEFFVEREIVETPRGIGRGIYYTFAGAALDLPVNDRNNFTVIAGAQEFTGDNVRLHLRANYVHVVKPEWGLSLQLRSRYFHSSDPGEYDYFSPRWYAQVMPVVQIRRFSGGWRYSAAAGYGGQRDSGSDWHSSRYFNAQVTSPVIGRSWFLKAGATYSNTPVGSGYVYDYLQVNFGVTRAF